MNAILVSIEQHKDLADVLIKVLGLIGTALGAVVVTWKYFHEKKAARLEELYSLRRQAYLDFFAIVPRQLAVVGGALNTRAEVPPFMLEEGFTVLHRLHVVAGSEALQCIIERNAIYHKGMIELMGLKQNALQIEAQRINPSTGASRKNYQAERISAWKAFAERHRELFLGLHGNYPTLVSLVRRDLGLHSNSDKITAAFERDQSIAVPMMDETYSKFMTQLMSPV